MSPIDADQIIREHGAALLGLALRYTRERDDAWDLLQDTFERSLRRPPAALTPGKARAWLSTIMRNLFIDAHRTSKVHARVVAALAQGDAADEIDEAAELPLWRTVDEADVLRCLGALPRTLREIFELHVEQGLGYEEIAARLGIPRATVGTRLLRMRRQLRRLVLEGSAARS